MERPKDIGPMLVDVDIAKESNKVESLYTRGRVVEYAKCFQKYLMDYTGLESVDCYVLEKPPYMNKGNCKNGFHLHFPTVWMSKNHRSLITKLVKETNITREFETLDDAAVRNNWLLYGSRKAEDQSPYKLSFVVNTDGTITTRRSSSILFKTLSIRNNPTKTTTTILEKYIDRPKEGRPLSPTSLADNNLITRCMEALDPSRADDYHDWIKIGCILYTIDKANGFQRWDSFSSLSQKHDLDYLFKTWGRFKEYNYTIGSLVYLAKQDNPNFSVKEPMTRLLGHRYTRRQLINMCRGRKLHNYTCC